MNIVLCGVCNFPASVHNDDARVDYVHVCSRYDESINANRNDFVAVEGPFKGKTVCDYFADVPSLRKALKSYNSEWSGYDYSAYLEHLNVVYILPDVEGTPATMTKDGLVMSGVAEDRRAPDGAPLVGIGADDHVNPNDSKWLDELDAIDNWRDATYRVTSNSKEWVSTTLLGQEPGEVLLTQYDSGKRSLTAWNEGPSDFSRNTYVEGFDGYTTVKLIDETLTAKYHARLLNVYRKGGNLRVGGVEIINNTDGSVSARCVRNNCPCAQPLTMRVTELTTREEFENFTWSVISHGNNHAANWFINRATYYKVHEFDCNLDKCDRNSYGCAHRKQPTSV